MELATAITSWAILAVCFFFWTKKRKRLTEKFQLEVANLTSEIKQLRRDMYEDEDRDAFKVGQKVICVSNEKLRSILTGEVICLRRGLPTIKDERTQKIYVCGGIVIPFSQEVLDALVKLDYIDRWNVLSKNHKLKRS